MRPRSQVVGIDLFAGAGGMSLGAQLAGVEVIGAVEADLGAASTYAANFPRVPLIVDDIRNVERLPQPSAKSQRVLFGGPPCQGFSTSNQRTRSSLNPRNWLFREFFRLARSWKPDWIVFENVRGIVETEKGSFLAAILNELALMGYSVSYGVLNALDFGVPQRRSRLFVIGTLNGKELHLPLATCPQAVTVEEALQDLPDLLNGASVDNLPYSREAESTYAKLLRRDMLSCDGHLVTRNAPHILERYRHVPPGGNWASIPTTLMDNYQEVGRCHTGIYHRLRADAPSVVIGNYRKNMLIHPVQDRGLSVREAARLQSFPDHFKFLGSIGFRQQQVGNAVPPMLAKAVFDTITQPLKPSSSCG